jgi:hypothetical protein
MVEGHILKRRFGRLIIDASAENGNISPAIRSAVVFVPQLALASRFSFRQDLLSR